ncbi:unnamed protein product [Linum tenue]|uniref:Thioredoxin domain-containing protein n=1 Tax=Linum tenue TaxID=586396 RepID=A0AAV0RB80_9ROSI|nr:unnamed protein product [Linum tenue]
MAYVASSNSVHTFRPHFPTAESPPVPFTRATFPFHEKPRRQFPVVACQTKSNSSTENSTVKEKQADSSVTNDAGEATSSSSDSAGLPEFPTRNLNRRIAVGSGLFGVGLFVLGRLDFGVSLKDLSAAALPYEEALSNGKPTVVEFYADWCQVCRVSPRCVQSRAAVQVNRISLWGQVNFVMLNVDNTKWEQELDEFGVEGIPHFAFLDRDGNEEGNVVGRLPRRYLMENVEVLAKGEATVLHARVVGQFSRRQNQGKFAPLAILEPMVD